MINEIVEVMMFLNLKLQQNQPISNLLDIFVFFFPFLIFLGRYRLFIVS